MHRVPVWAPCVVWLAMHGEWTSAVLLAAWGIIVVSMLDNIVKMYVLQNGADLHPLLAFISVVGALQVMGLWGIFIGPIVASCLFALIQIFNEELKEMSRERLALTTGTTPPELNSDGQPESNSASTTATLTVTTEPPKTERPSPNSGKPK